MNQSVGSKSSRCDALDPALERARHVPPVVSERLLDRLEDGALIPHLFLTGLQGTQGDALRPDRRRWSLSHVDAHAVEVADRRVALVGKERARLLVQPVRAKADADARALRSRVNHLAGAALAQVDERRADAALMLRRMHVAVAEDLATALVEDGGVARQRALRRQNEPGVQRGIDRLPVGENILGGPVVVLAKLGVVASRSSVRMAGISSSRGARKV